MGKGIIFGLLVWLIVSGAILLSMHISNSARLQVTKAVVYGLVTAIIAVGIITGIVVLF